MTELRIGSLCTGYGGLDMAVQQVLGGTTAWTSDIDPGAAQIITHRMPGTPNLGDLTTTDWASIEPVDVVTGGYPCQPFSTAGQRKGTADARHIWPHIANALRVLRPRIAIFENVAGHLRLGFDTVLRDLAAIGFDAQWCLVRASEIGAPHQRNRLFILATAPDTPSIGRREGRTEPARLERRPGATGGRGAAAADTDSHALRQQPVTQPRRSGTTVAELTRPRPAAHPPSLGQRNPRPTSKRGMASPSVAGSAPDRDWGRFGSAVQRWEAVTGRHAPGAVDDRGRLSPAFVEWLMGLEAGWVTDVPGLTRNQQLKALGNGVVPQQAEAAIRLLHQRADRSSGSTTTRTGDPT